MSQKPYKYCQSCSMPLSKDPNGGGTEADGSLSPRFCSFCYADGRFTAPDMTVDDMRLLVKNKMKEMGFPGFLASFFTLSIPNLERWKTK